MNRRKKPASATNKTKTSHFRIIAGQWRSRKLAFPEIPGLRPTPDRVRETLFNWLHGELHDTRCLDLFAGSGALGMEALSRGAKSCSFVDASPIACEHIQQNLKLVGHAASTTITGKLPQALDQLTDAFDLVFLDPPYALDTIEDCIAKLISKHLLTDNALIYIENSSQHPLPSLGNLFKLQRQKQAGEVQYSLWQYQPETSLSAQDSL